MGVSVGGGMGGLLGDGPKDTYKGNRKQYTELKNMVMDSPYLNRVLNMGNLGFEMGARQADAQTMSVMNALSARGGGNINDAVSLGAQGRVGAQLQGLEKSASMLQGAEMARLSLLANLYASFSGVSSTMIGGQYGQGNALMQGAGGAGQGMATTLA
jgi:hypothetical protein